MKLSDSIWITRKCHISAEERLNRWSLLANLTLTVYSVNLLVASLIALKVQLQQFELVSLVGSVLILVASVFVWGLRFSERASQFKASYIRLQTLHQDAIEAEAKQNSAALAIVQRTYSDILQSCENHSDQDFLKLRFTLRASNSKTVEDVTKSDYALYFGRIFMGFISKVVLILGPVVVMYWYVRGF